MSHSYFFLLRMSATGRSYLQISLKVHYIIIQAILGRKSRNKFTVTDRKIFGVYKAFDRKRYWWYEFKDFPHTNFRKRLSV